MCSLLIKEGGREEGADRFIIFGGQEALVKRGEVNISGQADTPEGTMIMYKYFYCATFTSKIIRKCT